MLKRCIDIVVGLTGLIVAAPIMLVIAGILKFESKGPIIYRCRRIGRCGQSFDMLKFRSMLANADSIDCKLCINSDVRVTTFGSFLRRTKLNELPQLFNVIKGDMSLVGPRPEDPKFMTHYSDKWDVVLQVRPGIMGPNQILHRNEEDLFPPERDPEKFYIESILPEKLDRDVDYVLTRNMWRDLALLTTGVYVSIFRGEFWSRIWSHPDLLWQITLDTTLSLGAYVAACFLRFETLDFEQGFWINLLIIVVVNPIVFGTMGLYRRSPRFFSVPDLFMVAKVVAVAGVVQIIGNAFFVPLREHSRAVFSLYPLILLALMTGARILQQLALEKLERKPLEGRKSKNVLIYGAGRLGLETAQRLQFEGGIHITGFVDDDPKMRNRSLLGIKVMGTGSDLAFLKALHRVEKVFIAFNPQKSKALKRARQRCIDAGLPDILIRSGIPEVPGKLLSSRAYFRGIRFSDVLGMKEVQLDLDKLEPFVEGSVVAVVGAGDQLGEQICRELVRLRAGKLVIIEECQARLSRINEVLHSIGGSRTAYFSYFHPLGFHELTEKVMKSHNVRWVIFNQTNRAMANSDLNLPTLVFANFVNAVRYVEMAKRLKWNFLTFVSPYLKASFSPAERNLHLLAENYVTYAARSADTGFGIVRVSNILENDDETFRNACERISREKPVSFLDEEMKFSSARYSARVVLNCLPLHDRGETFVDGAGLFMDLRALLDFYYEIQGNQKARAFVRSLPLEKDDQKHIASPQSDVCCLPTNSPNILMLSGQKLVEADGHEELIKLNMHYLSPPEKEAIDCFFSFLRNGDGQSAYSTMKSHHENTTVLRNYC